MNNNENKQNEDIEVVIGDESLLNISQVGHYVGDLKPKTSDKKSKQVIIPKNKKTSESDASNVDPENK